MVEGTPLLREHLGKTWIEGSNPSVSANDPVSMRLTGAFSFWHTIKHTKRWCVARLGSSPLMEDRAPALWAGLLSIRSPSETPPGAPHPRGTPLNVQMGPIGSSTSYSGQASTQLWRLVARFRIWFAPPEQVLLTRSAGLAGAQSPAPRGAFCYGLLTDPMATHPRNPSQTPFRLRTS